jgi:hypothetical protein
MKLPARRMVANVLEGYSAARRIALALTAAQADERRSTASPDARDQPFLDELQVQPINLIAAIAQFRQVAGAGLGQLRMSLRRQLDQRRHEPTVWLRSRHPLRAER